MVQPWCIFDSCSPYNTINLSVLNSMYFTAFSMLVHHNCTTDNNRTIRSFDLQGVCQFMTQIKYLLSAKKFMFLSTNLKNVCYIECSDDRKRIKRLKHTKIFEDLFTDLITRHYFITNEYNNYLQKHKSLLKISRITIKSVNRRLFHNKKER